MSYDEVVMPDDLRQALIDSLRPASQRPVSSSRYMQQPNSRP